jgi:hypothetical protein
VQAFVGPQPRKKEIVSLHGHHAFMHKEVNALIHVYARFTRFRGRDLYCSRRDRLEVQFEGFLGFRPEVGLAGRPSRNGAGLILLKLATFSIVRMERVNLWFGSFRALVNVDAETPDDLARPPAERRVSAITCRM